MAPRKLSLKRESLHQLSSDELAGVAGAGTVSDTCFSCLTYISCNPLHCVTRSYRYCVASLPTECVESYTC